MPPNKDFPFAPGVIDPEPAPRSALASRAIWLGGAISVAAWTALVWWLTR